MTRLALVLLAGLLVWGCRQAPEAADAQPPVPSAAQAAAEAEAASVEAVVIGRTPVVVYPAAAEARLFVQDGRDADGRGTYSDADGRRLTASERQAIERTFETKHYGPGVRSVAACFIPHHFVRYYDASGRQIGQIAICFCCAGIQAEPHLEQQRGPRGTEDSELSFDYDALKSVVEAMGVRTDIECD